MKVIGFASGMVLGMAAAAAAVSAMYPDVPKRIRRDSGRVRRSIMKLL